MCRKVYTYTSIRELDKHPRYAELVRYPHITATGDLYRVMQEQYKQFQAVLDIHVLQKSIIARWEDPDVSFQQFINISRAIRTLPIRDEEKIIHGSFIKNKAQVLNAIRLLVEADVEPNDIAPTCIEEGLFQRIWVELEREDNSFRDFREVMELYSEDNIKFESALQKNAPCMQADTIVLHGFYFITPIQERIFDMLENCGKTLIFLCCIDETVPEVEEIWYKVLSEHNKFDPPAQWCRDNVPSLRNQPFGSAFGMTPSFEQQHHVSIIKYRSEIDFVRDVKRLLEKDLTIYSTDLKATDELLKEFYPSVYKRRHLLSYPVGQYIYRLHSMWSAKEQGLVMTIDDVQACFASGWVEYNGINAIKYMPELEKIKTYVSDCHTIEEWEERLTFLQGTKDTVLAAFEEHLDQVPLQNQRWHRMMADPFLALSCFDQSREQLDTLIGMIRHLIRTARTLFAGPGEITISEHMAKVREILAEGKEEAVLLEEENAVIEELISRLKYHDLGVDTCLPGEISEAIMIVIGGGILDEDSYNIQSGRNGSFVKPLYQVESAPILGNGKVHLCLSDEQRLPGKIKPYVWPLSNEFLERLKIAEGERRHQYLNDMRFIIENSPLANRYLFFSLLQNAEVELSWIATEDEKELSSSPYIQILEQLFKVPEQNVQKQRWALEEIRKIEGQRKETVMQVDLSCDSAAEAQLDVSLCPLRYIYSYVLSEFPTYTSDFHYNFVLSNLIGALVGVSGISKNTIGKEVLELFPYLRDVEKRQILDHVPTSRIDKVDILDDISYPQVRLLVHFLNKEIKVKAETRLREQVQRSLCYEADLEANGEYENCMYCPYNAICPHAEHSVSRESSDG